MNCFKYFALLFLSVSSFFAVGFDTPRVPITVVFDRSSNNPFASSPRTYNDIFSKFPTIDSGRPGKLPATDVFTTTRQPEKGWSAEQFSNYFIQTSSQESRILKDTPWCSANSPVPRVTYLTSECYELTPARQLDILKQYDLYQHPGFAEYIKTFSECKAFAQDYCNKLNNPEFSKQMSYYRGLNETMTMLNEQFQQEKPAQNLTVRTFHTPTASTDCSTCTSHKCLQDNLGEIGKRIEVVTKATDGLTKIIYEAYTLGAQEGTVVGSFGGDVADYTQCSGTVLQQATHARIIDMLEQYVKLPSESKLREYQEKFGMYVDTARQYNQANQISKANRILDFCQIAIDCSKAVCEGIYEGVKEAVFDILNHPVEVGLCLVAGEYVLAYQASKMAVNFLDIGLTYLANPEAGIAKWNAYVEPVTKLASALYNKQIALRDGIKGVTKFAVQWKMQGAIFGGLHRACSTAANKLGKLANKVPGIKSAERMVTPEGMHFNAADNAIRGKNQSSLTSIVADQIGKREQVLPKVATYEQARNKALEIIGKVDQHTGRPHIGKMGAGKGQIVGRDWHGNKVSMRLDYDPVKGPHINVTDYRVGRGKNGTVIAIPFKGNESNVVSMLRHLNSRTSLEVAKSVFEKIGDTKNVALVRESLAKFGR